MATPAERLITVADTIYTARRGLDALQEVGMPSILRLAVASASTHLVFAERFLRWAVKGRDFSGQLPPPFTG